jgi:hypothetical protein
VGLVAIAIKSPCLYLASIELAAVQQFMKRMAIVVTLGPNLPQPLLQFL